MSGEGTWLAGLQREARIRRGLVLYGNTRDIFWDEGERAYVTLPELLARRLLPGATVRATWDRAEGLRFATPEERGRWDDAVRRVVGGGAAKGERYTIDDDGGQAAEGAQALELVELLARYRRVLAEGRERPLVIVDWSHLLATQPAHPDGGERAWILELGKALVGAPTQQVDSDTLKASAGLLVLVSASLGAVPPAVYQGEPRVKLVALATPGLEDRRAFFERHADDVNVELPRATPGARRVVPPRAAKVDALADLTDQLTTADLRQVVALSRLSAPLRPDRLLNLYRFGDQRSPWEELDEAKLGEARERLAKRVIGQPAAVGQVATMILRAWLGLAGLQHSARRSKPKGTLFFVGPTGVGKTELAKATAELLFGDEAACIRFDMSEFNHEHSDQRLVGAPPGYVGFEDGGQLTNAIAARPFSVLLFDEIEKAHPRVLDKFLQILEDGRLTDGRGETAWFSEAVIIFTSNIGAANVPGDMRPEDYERHFREQVEDHFLKRLGRPELLNRIGDNIVVFQPVTDERSRRDILERKLEPLRSHLRERWGVRLQIDAEARACLVAGARSEHGGRGLLNVIERALVNPLATYMFEHLHQLSDGRTLVVSGTREPLDIELTDG